MSRFEIAIFITTSLWLYLAAAQRMTSWPLAMVKTILIFCMMVRSKHYAEAGIQSFVFLPIIIYGWYNWLRGPQNEKRVLTTREISLRERNGAMFLFGVGAIGIATLYYFYDPDLNYLVEAPLTMLAAIALFFMARKTFQTWKVNTYAHVLIMCATLWSGINLRGIQVYTYIVLCLYGWWMWYRENGAVASSVD